METIEEIVVRLGGTLTDVGDMTIPAQFTRPTASHRAVRAGVGVTIHPWGSLSISGDDSGEFLDNTITCRLPAQDGDVRYGFLLDPEGAIEADMYVVNTPDRYLCLTAPGTVETLTETLSSRTFIQDVAVENVSDDHVVFGVHGPTAMTKLTSVMPTGTPPQSPLQMDRGVVREQGVSVLRLDAPTGERGYIVVCRTEDGSAVFDALVNLGALATPFGYDTWCALTLEAGTPLFETELAGRTPNVTGQLTAGVSLEKGCFIGQETVARIANLSDPRRRLVGVIASQLPAAPAEISTDNGRNGVLTRGLDSPVMETAIGMAFLPAEVEEGATVRIDDAIDAKVTPLPFVTGGEGSARCPQYHLKSA